VRDDHGSGHGAAVLPGTASSTAQTGAAFSNAGIASEPINLQFHHSDLQIFYKMCQ